MSLFIVFCIGLVCLDVNIDNMAVHYVSIKFVENCCAFEIYFPILVTILMVQMKRVEYNGTSELNYIKLKRYYGLFVAILSCLILVCFVDCNFGTL